MTRRSFADPPSSVIDPGSRAPRFGAYRGALPPADFGPLGCNTLYRVAHHKRWVYAAIASNDLFLGVAIVRLGYAANAFAFLKVRGEDGLRFDRSLMGPPFAATVADAGGEGCDARYRIGRVSMRIARRSGASHYEVDVGMKDLVVQARLHAAAAPPPLGVIAPIPGGLVDVTEKRVLLPAEGEVTAHGKRFRLENAVGGLDFTSGYLARRTAWRWAFAMGRARSGERVAWNLVEGFVGEPECAVWIEDALHPVGEGVFVLDRSRPLSPWQIRTRDGAVDVTFEPGGLHAESKDLVLVKSRFVQPVGTFRGRIAIPGAAPLEVEAVPGVVEDQDVLW